MSGSVVTQMTSEQMRQSRQAGTSLSDWEAIRVALQHGDAPADDEDSPDATLAMRAELAKPSVGRPLASTTKEQIAIRFDREVLAAFRSTGAGWQTRMNAALKEWLTEHPPLQTLKR